MDREVDWLLQEKYDGVTSEAFLADCKRLAAGEPLGYVIGSVPFLNTTILLDSRPLIPRAETEYWTEHAIDHIRQRFEQTSRKPSPKILTDDHTPHILDLCAGSGCIGIAIAKALPNIQVDFSEIEPAHLPTIKHNLEHNQINQRRTEIIASDLFSKVTKTYNIILSNPPYIDKTLNRVDTSVVLYEPAAALYGGMHGLKLISKIIATAPNHLKPAGELWLEHEPEQTPFIHSLGTKHNFMVTTRPDQYGVDRYSILVLQ